MKKIPKNKSMCINHKKIDEAIELAKNMLEIAKQINDKERIEYWGYMYSELKHYKKCYNNQI